MQNTSISNQKTRLDLKSKRASLLGFQIGAVARLIWTVARVSFQMRPSMHRKSRISNPTFKTSPHICSKSGGRSPPLFYYASPCPSEAAGALSLRSMALLAMARLIKPFTLSLWASAWGPNKWPVLLLARVIVSINSSKRYSVSCFSPMQSRT